jgi:3-methyladenine DNA glycosylase AlkD
LNAVDAAFEGLGIVKSVARLVRAEDLRDLAEQLGATRNLDLVKIVLAKKIRCVL